MKLTYSDILTMPHHTSQKRLPMSETNRAAQFAPFAALTGYEEVIDEAGRLTQSLTEWDEDIQADVNRTLTEALTDALTVQITYFVPDSRKEGGAYRTAVGQIRRIDEIARALQMEDRTVIPLAYVTEIEKEIP